MSLMFGGRCGIMICLQVVVLIIANIHMCKADYLIRTKVPPEYRVSMILNPALAVNRGSGRYSGFLPELFWALKERNAIPDTYRIIDATDNHLGRRDESGNWTGLMGDVLSSTTKLVYIGAGPILDVGEHATQVTLSTSWATVDVHLVVKKTSNVTTLKEAMDGGFVPYVVQNSAEHQAVINAIQNQNTPKELVDLHRTLRVVESVQHGLNLVEKEDKVCLVLNTVEARYHVTHSHCNLVVTFWFLRLGSYVFAIPRNEQISHHINDALKRMKNDTSLDKLMNQHLGVLGVCSRGASHDATGPIVAFLATSLLTTLVRILS